MFGELTSYAHKGSVELPIYADWIIHQSTTKHLILMIFTHKFGSLDRLASKPNPKIQCLLRVQTAAPIQLQETIMNATKATAMKKSIADKQAQLRKEVFGEVDPQHIWSRKTAKGFTTVPRSMPLIGAIMDGLAGKGKPVATTYLELWCRSNDDGFVTLSKQAETAFASGFSGERAVSTWKERVKKLEGLGFLVTKPGVSGSLHYVQLWNPYIVIKFHKTQNTQGFRTELYHALFERVQDIGASDLDE